MRLLIYGMQSSGASTFALLLAQRSGSIAFVDIWSMFAAPELDTKTDVIAKAVVTTAFPLQLHKCRLRPDATILFLRHPLDTYDSLVQKAYANDDGLVDEKFAVLEETFKDRDAYDGIVHYEDLLFSPSRAIALAAELGWSVADGHQSLTRRQCDIVAFNEEQVPGIGRRLKYGAGNHNPALLSLSRLKFRRAQDPSSARLRELCPQVVAHYDEMIAARSEEWDVAEPPVLGCDVSRLIARLCPNPARLLLDRYRLVVGDGVFVKGVSSEHFVVSGSGGTMTVTGLPGSPFNLLTGTVTVHREMGSTEICVQLLDGAGARVGRQSLTLSRGDRRTIRVETPAGTAGPLDLELDMRSVDPDAAGVVEVIWSELRLEHA